MFIEDMRGAMEYEADEWCDARECRLPYRTWNSLTGDY